MNDKKQNLVLRGETKYLEQRVERVHAFGFIDDVYTQLVELDEEMLTKKTIRIYDISTTTKLIIPEHSFHFGKCFENLRWKRNSKIEFDGTVYKLDKCKGKNDQKPGSKEIWDIRNLRNVEVIEFETNNRYRPIRKNRSKSNAVSTRIRREAILALQKEQEADRANSSGRNQ